MRKPIEQRLRRLEERQGNRVAVMWRHEDEPDEVAHQRWQAANPGIILGDKDLRVIIVSWSRCGEVVAPRGGRGGNWQSFEEIVCPRESSLGDVKISGCWVVSRFNFARAYRP